MIEEVIAGGISAGVVSQDKLSSPCRPVFSRLGIEVNMKGKKTVLYLSIPHLLSPLVPIEVVQFGAV